ncbi:hypothetical protein ACOMHN_038067 [Nucella lapillus]
MAGGIKDFLTSIGMGRHVGMFHMRGYDHEADIPHLNVSDLQTIGITDPMETIILLKAAHSYKHRPEYKLFRWLREHELSHYYEGFVQSGRVLLPGIAQLNLPDEEVYDELEITLPGHQRRLECAVQALRKRHRPESESSEGEGEEEEEDRMVAEGWWGYPPYLSNAKFPFLCVKATIQSTHQPDCRQVFDFMVDSGSDVCTLRRELIEPLQLESLSTVRSVGAHGSVRTTMYRAFIVLGDAKMEVEVIASSYDSVGSQVLRHFSHHIDGVRHKWFRISNTNTSSHSARGQAEPVSQEEEDASTEAETIPVLPERERGAVPCSGTVQNNPDGGGGGLGGDESRRDGEHLSQGGSVTGRGDETDSLFGSSSWHRHAPSSSGMSYRQKNPAESLWSLPYDNNAVASSQSSSRHKTFTESSWTLPYDNSSVITPQSSSQHVAMSRATPQHRNMVSSSQTSLQHKNSTDHSLTTSAAVVHYHPSTLESLDRRPRSSSDTTGGVYHLLDNAPRTYHQTTVPATLSQTSPQGFEPSSWTDPQSGTSTRSGQQKYSRQSGRLMISENGTISLSFGREGKRKREDSEGLGPDSDL